WNMVKNTIQEKAVNLWHYISQTDNSFASENTIGPTIETTPSGFLQLNFDSPLEPLDSEVKGSKSAPAQTTAPANKPESNTFIQARADGLLQLVIETPGESAISIRPTDTCRKVLAANSSETK